MDGYEIIINYPLLLVIFAVCGIFIIFAMLKKTKLTFKKILKKSPSRYFSYVLFIILPKGNH